MRTVIIATLVILSLYGFAEVKDVKKQSEIANEWKVIEKKIGNLNSTMCARKPQLPYQLGCKWFAMPTDSVLEKCEAAGVEYVIITNIEKLLRPQFVVDVMKGNMGNYTPCLEPNDYYLLLKLQNKTEG